MGAGDDGDRHLIRYMLDISPFPVVVNVNVTVPAVVSASEGM